MRRSVTSRRKGETVMFDPKYLVDRIFRIIFVAAVAFSAHAAPAYFEVSKGAHPHDVAAAPGANAAVYYTAQMTGKLGVLDPKSGKYEEVPLGSGSAPHG